jgi:hypothetical protein
VGGKARSLFQKARTLSEDLMEFRGEPSGSRRS